MPGVGRSTDGVHVDDSIPAAHVAPSPAPGVGASGTLEIVPHILSAHAPFAAGSGDVEGGGREGVDDVADNDHVDDVPEEEENTTPTTVEAGADHSQDEEDPSGSEGAFDAVLEGLSADASSPVEPFVSLNNKLVRCIASFQEASRYRSE